MIVEHQHSIGSAAIPPSIYVSTIKHLTSDHSDPGPIPASTFISKSSSIAKVSEYLPQPLDRLGKAGGATPAFMMNRTVTTPSLAMTPSNSLPPTYAAVADTRTLEEEPNPFEQSFSSSSSSSTLSSRVISRDVRLVLPPLASIDNPAARMGIGVINGIGSNHILRKTKIACDSLRASALSPSMLTGPAKQKYPVQKKHQETRLPMMRGNGCFLSTPSPMSSDSFSALSPFSFPEYQRSSSRIKYEREPQYQHHNPAVYAQASSSIITSSPGASMTESGSRDDASAGISNIASSENRISSRLTFMDRVSTTSATNAFCGCLGHKRHLKKPSEADKDQKRKSFLERNRQAALKCRQRKKQWMNDLQAKVEFLTTDNEHLQMEVIALREQLHDLKSLLLEHKACPDNPHAITEAINRSIPGLISRPTNPHRHYEESELPSVSLAPPNRYASYTRFFSVEDGDHHH